MDPFDRQIVQYVRLWAPYGGPPQEEILPRFGLSVPQFKKRFRDIVTALRAGESALGDEDRDLLETVQHLVTSR
jgi:hypothetical protein